MGMAQKIMDTKKHFVLNKKKKYILKVDQNINVSVKNIYMYVNKIKKKKL